MTLGDQNQTNIHVQQREMERFQMIQQENTERRCKHRQAYEILFKSLEQQCIHKRHAETT